MSEVEKMYENVLNLKQKCSNPYIDPEYCAKDCKECKDFRYDYPSFTAEKQLEIEKVILQNKKNYNKWIEYNINVYGEWVMRFVKTDEFAPYIALGKTRAEAFANVINYFWQSLTDAEKVQIRNILK